MNETMTKETEEITASEVASYLRRHPTFLNEFPDVALNLLVPREQGSTTSLASYQVEVLREKKNRRLIRLPENPDKITHFQILPHFLWILWVGFFAACDYCFTNAAI